MVSRTSRYASARSVSDAVMIGPFPGYSGVAWKAHADNRFGVTSRARSLRSGGLAAHRRFGRRPVGRDLAVLDQPGVTLGHQEVAVAAAVVEPDMGDHGEVGVDPRLAGRHLGEQHVRDVMAHNRFDAGLYG